MSRMHGASEYQAAVVRLWQEHLGTAFPAGLRGAELAGIDMVMLDASIAGCISTWHNNGGSLDAERLRILHDCLTELEQTLPLITEGEEVQYCRGLQQLATLASHPGSQTP
jgi:hypothetical protein